MINEKFLYLKGKGSAGELFFIEQHNELLQHPIVLLEDMTSWNIEGSDLGAERLQMKPIKGTEGLFNGFDNLPSILSGCREYCIKMQYGGAEIKTVGWDQFIPRTGIDNDPTSTVGLGMWNGTKDLPNGKTLYLRSSHGNLHRWMEPSVENHGARPMVLDFLLETIDINRMTGKEKKRFFCSIAFEDVDALLERLKEYAAQFRLDLNKWDEQIPVGEEAQNFTIPGLFFQGNMWHVPMSVLGDLATVTMIGNDPSIYPTGHCSVEIQRSRLENLKRLAGARWIPQEKKSNNDELADQDLLDLWHRRMMLGIPHYPGLLDMNGIPLT